MPEKGGHLDPNATRACVWCGGWIDDENNQLCAGCHEDLRAESGARWDEWEDWADGI